MKLKSMIKVGDRVALSSGEDAVWWDVLEVEGFQLTIRETGTENRPQYTDTCFVKRHKGAEAET